MCEYTHTKAFPLYEQDCETERSDLGSTQSTQGYCAVASAILNEFQSSHKTTEFSYMNTILGYKALELLCQISFDPAVLTTARDNITSKA